MKNTLKALLALPLALFLALGMVGLMVSSTPRPAFADEAAVDNQFVDGNWFSIATAKGEAYKEGSPTEVALQAQIGLYQEAVTNEDTEKAEHYAIRSWVKANYAMELGRQALEAGKQEDAREHLNRALKLAKAAQRSGAGKGEQEDRVCDDSAGAWRGCSKIEGQRAERRIGKLLARLGGE
jgi:hypothetical protein